MALVVPNLGEQRLLEYLVGKSSPTGSKLYLRLYTNSLDLSNETFVTSSFTEASASGYAVKTLTSSNWGASTNGSGITSMSYSTGVTFAFTAGQDIQGYYVTNAEGETLWAEEFPGAPFSLPVSTGGEIAIRPQLQLN